MSSIDSLPAARPIERTNADTVAVVSFGLACMMGLVGAFVGLGTHGFWFDELFTAWFIEPDGTSLLSRIVTDVHPPLYLVGLSLYSQLAGDSDVALRSLSALSACGAILVFVAATRRSFSLPARLFGAAMATGSLFWFFQAQNARSYALCLLISAAIMACCLALLDERQDRRKARLLFGGMIAIMFTGSFVHFYVVHESLAVLLMLFVLGRRYRYAAAVGAIAMLAALALYMKLVVEPHSQVTLGNYWIQNNPTWYYLVLKSCLQYTFGDAGLLAIALCGCAYLAARTSRPLDTPVLLDRTTRLLLGVPVVVLVGAVASSVLLAPSFFDRNYLVLSPFFWALSARLYDAARQALRTPLRLPLNVALGVVLLSMASIVAMRLPSDRALSIYQPFRESAEWIKTLPACRGQIVPVITTDRASWYKPGYAETIYGSAHGRYLGGFAQPRLLFFEEIRAHRLTPDLMALLRQRVDGEGCPVLAWAAHNVTAEIMAAAQDGLLAGIGRSDEASGVGRKAFTDGGMSFVLYRKKLSP